MNATPIATAPTASRTHIRKADHLACVVLGDPLPCTCPDCRKAAGGWEAERTVPEIVTRQLPPAFWTRQESCLSARLSTPPGMARAWMFVPAAALGLVLLLFLTPARKAAPPRVEPESAYDVATRALDERPALGGLEACGLLFAGEESSIMEENL